MELTENKLYVPNSISGSLPSMVKNELAKMSAQKQEEFIEEYKRKKKSLGFTYVLWFFLGWHYAYTRKWGIQVLFWFTVGGLFVWWFIDIFRIPGMIKNYNKDVAMDVMRNLKAISN
ncbi:MAG: TM2 domain-containing protein [Flavobacterium sp.]|nr:TM2 domain-containing protein [Flavobacterium sp.]